MKTIISHYLAGMIRVDTYGTEHPLTPANEPATALFTELKTVIVDMSAAIATQEGGFAEGRGATADLLRVAADLRADLRDVTKTARTFDPEQFPGVRGEFSLPRSKKLAVLVGTAHSFLGQLTNPLKAAFIAHGLRADFDEQIQGKAALLDATLARQNAGVMTRKRGTLGLENKARRGMEIVRALDAIHRNKLRTSDPVLFGVWNAAKRLESVRRTKRQVAGANAPTPAASPTGAPAPAPAPTNPA